MSERKNLILGLDVSTKTIGIAVFEDNGKKGELKMLTHVTPKIKISTENSIEVLVNKIRIFEEHFLSRYSDAGINKVIIEEPLLGSNNAYTVGALLKYNGMITKSVYDILGIAPEFISSYDARKYAFPNLYASRVYNKKNELIPENKRGGPVLFGEYPIGVDKKKIIFENVSKMEPQIQWFYDKNKVLSKESYDAADAYTCVIGYMRKIGKWV